MNSFQNLLTFQPEKGQILLGTERAMLFRQKAFEILRALMLNHLGPETTHSILFNFGYQSAKDDYSEMEKSICPTHDIDRLSMGPLIHALHGIVLVEPEIQEYDRESQHFYFKGKWRGSFEAEIYKNKFGISETPVCYSLCGYGSGWCSSFLGTPVLEIETKCEAQGHDYCEWEIRPLDAWGAQAQPWLKAYQHDYPSLIAELNLSRNRLQNLNRDLETMVRQRTESLSTLLGILCHDIRAPLKRLAQSQEMNRIDIQQTTRSILEILEDVEYEEIQKLAHPKDSFESLELLTAIDTAKKYCESHRRSKDIRIVSEINQVEVSLPIGARHNLETHILPNILNNAIHHSPYKSKILISHEIHQDGVFLRIKDEGFGIRKETIAKLLNEPVPSNSPTGSGKGLYYANKLAKAHGVKLSLESTYIGDNPLDHGTAVSLFFPHQKRLPTMGALH